MSNYNCINFAHDMKDYVFVFKKVEYFNTIFWYGQNETKNQLRQGI